MSRVLLSLCRRSGGASSVGPLWPRQSTDEQRQVGTDAPALQNLAYVAQNFATKPSLLHGMPPVSGPHSTAVIPGLQSQTFPAAAGAAASGGGPAPAMDPAAAVAAAQAAIAAAAAAGSSLAPPGQLPVSSLGHPMSLLGPATVAAAAGTGLGADNSNGFEHHSKRQRTGGKELTMPGSPGKGGLRAAAAGGRTSGVNTPTREIIPGGGQGGLLELQQGLGGMSPFQVHARPLAPGLTLQGQDFNAALQQVCSWINRAGSILL